MKSHNFSDAVQGNFSLAKTYQNMLKDLPDNTVVDIGVAVVQEQNETGELEWNVYLLNFKKEEIENVLVSSKGYGSLEGEQVKTSVLRHVLGDIPAESCRKIEPIMDKLFGLNNEYWVSYYHGGVIYDKKYVFLPESVVEENMITIPLLGKKGVMIR